MSCRHSTPAAPPATLLAVLFSINQAAKTVNATGSIGTWIRLKIFRGSGILEMTATVPNTGANILAYTTTLQNGDYVCVEVSDTFFFSYTDMDEIQIPTPGFSFVPIFNVTNFIQISFEAAPSVDAFSAPNSTGTDTLVFTFTLQDSAGVTGTITLTGQKSAFMNVDDITPYVPTGTSGTTTVTTGFGNITVVATYGGGYNLQNNKWAYASLVDQRGVSSEQDEAGLTCAIMVDGSTYLMDDAGTPITYLQV